MKDPIDDPNNTTYMPAGNCPDCGSKHDAATDASGRGARPSPGDLTICTECGCLSQYGQRFELSKYEGFLSDEERALIGKTKKWLRERIN